MSFVWLPCCLRSGFFAQSRGPPDIPFEERTIDLGANDGAAGIDEETIAMFEQNLSKNLYKLWNRMSSGSYFPPPVKQVQIPKGNGGFRKLGIPTVSDRIAQTVVKLIIEPIIDPVFHPDSYGYRP